MDETLQSTSPLGAPDRMATFTTLQLALIVLFALVVLVGLWWGVRKRRERVAAERELESRGNVQRVGDGAPVSDPDAPGAAIVAERRAPVDPENLPAPAPPLASVPEARSPGGQGIDRVSGIDAAVSSAPAAATKSRDDLTPPQHQLPTDEASEPAAPVTSAPVAAAAIHPAPAAPVADLTTLKGLGPKVAAQLAARGIVSIADLAALSPDDADRLDSELGVFRGRMTRDRWVEQAQLLSSGDRAAYEAKFGKLG